MRVVFTVDSCGRQHGIYGSVDTAEIGGAIVIRSSALSGVVFTCAVTFCFASHVIGGTTVYTDKSTFLAATDAIDVSGPLPAAGGPIDSPLTIGHITVFAQRFWLLDYSSRLVGTEIGISFGAGGSNDNLDVTLAASAYSFGFDFVEPEFDPYVNAPFIDSEFTVTLKSAGSAVGNFTFNAPNDIAAFVGVWNTEPFDFVEIRETIGGNENEFYGQFFASFVGDINFDGVVGVGDLGILAGFWGLPDTIADINGDGVVGVGDLAMLAANWTPAGGGSLSSATVVPVPSAGLVGLVLLGAMGSVRRRRAA